MGVIGNCFLTDDIEIGGLKTFHHFAETVFLPMSVSLFVDFGLAPAIGNEEILIERKTIGCGEINATTRLQTFLDAGKELIKRGRIEMFKNLGEEN